MIQGKRKEELTPETVLNKISEYDIFRYYMPHPFKLNAVTFSPFRKEDNPSFIIGNKRGFISFIDFADTNKRGNCFQFVKFLYNLASFDDVLRMIDRDFGLGIFTRKIGDYKQITSGYKQPEMEKRYSLIQVKTRKFNHDELAYWNQYHQDIQDLRDNNVYAVKSVYLNKSRFPIADNELTFGYLYEGQYWKIYRPFADRKSKWVPNNTPITTMDGKEDIKYCNTAFINKSKKDYMVMKKIFPCSCAVQNEGIACFSQENVDYLKANSDIQILSFDSDVTGVENSQQITKLFDFGYCNVPRKYLTEGIKDWADLAKEHGMEAIENYLKKKNLL
jgi:hypothetical protein